MGHLTKHAQKEGQHSRIKKANKKGRRPLTHFFPKANNNDIKNISQMCIVKVAWWYQVNRAKMFGGESPNDFSTIWTKFECDINFGATLRKFQRDKITPMLSHFQQKTLST